MVWPKVSLSNNVFPVPPLSPPVLPISPIIIPVKPGVDFASYVNATSYNSLSPCFDGQMRFFLPSKLIESNRERATFRSTE